MAGQNGELKFTMRDNTRELSSIAVHTGEITAGTIAGALGQIGPLRTAIEGITLGVMAKETLSVFQTQLSALAAASPLAQRGVKWTVGYRDTMQFVDSEAGGSLFPNPGYNQIFTFQIPTADLSLLESGEEYLDLTATPVAAFVTAFEAIARSPYGGEVDVLYIRYAD